MQSISSSAESFTPDGVPNVLNVLNINGLHPRGCYPRPTESAPNVRKLLLALPPKKGFFAKKIRRGRWLKEPKISRLTIVSALRQTQITKKPVTPDSICDP